MDNAKTIHNDIITSPNGAQLYLNKFYRQTKIHVSRQKLFSIKFNSLSNKIMSNKVNFFCELFAKN